MIKKNKEGYKIVLDPFCMKLFKTTNSNRAIIDFDPEEFEEKVNELYDPKNLKDG